MAGLLDGLFGGQQQQPYDWMQPEPKAGGLGGLLGNLGANKNQIAGYLAGILQPGNVNEQMSRGLMGMVSGSQSDILQQTRQDALNLQRQQRGGAARLIDQEVKAGKMSPQDANFFANNPKAWEEYSKARYGATPPTFAPDGTAIQPMPFGRSQVIGSFPKADKQEIYDPNSQRMMPAYTTPPTAVNPRATLTPVGQQPQAPQAPQAPMGPQSAPLGPPQNKVASSPKWWGTDEGENAGLYQKPSSGVFTAPSPREKVESEGLGKTFTDQYKNLLEKGSAAGAMKSTLNRMSQLSDNMLEGAAAPAVQMLRSALTTFGIGPDKKVAAGEEFSALANKMVLDAQGGSLGTGVSNADVAYISNTNPNMSHTKEGRREIIATRMALAEREQQVAKMAGEWRRAHGTMDGFDTAVGAWAEKNPMFKGRENVQDFGNRFGASGAPASGQPAQQSNPRAAIEAEIRRRGLRIPQ